MSVKIQIFVKITQNCKLITMACHVPRQMMFFFKSLIAYLTSQALELPAGLLQWIQTAKFAERRADSFAPRRLSLGMSRRLVLFMKRPHVIDKIGREPEMCVAFGAPVLRALRVYHQAQVGRVRSHHNHLLSVVVCSSFNSMVSPLTRQALIELLEHLPQ